MNSIGKKRWQSELERIGSKKHSSILTIHAQVRREGVARPSKIKTKDTTGPELVILSFGKPKAHLRKRTSTKEAGDEEKARRDQRNECKEKRPGHKKTPLRRQ